MVEENIWKDIEPKKIVLPGTILENYANSFNEAFKGRIVMKLSHKINSGITAANIEELLTPGPPIEPKCVYRMDIEVPELQGYAKLLLKVTYQISSVYPCKIEDSINQKEISCSTNDEFNKAVHDTLKSPEIIDLLSTLLAQILL